MPSDALGLAEGAKGVLAQEIRLFTWFALTAASYEKVREIADYVLESTPKEIPEYERGENLEKTSLRNPGGKDGRLLPMRSSDTLGRLSPILRMIRMVLIK